MPVDSTTSIYAEVKAWIAQQEAYEATTKTPAPLTNAQRKALEVLRIPIALPSPPELDDVDYISLLNRYRQAHPGGNDIKLEPEAASSKVVGDAVRFTCPFTLSEAKGHLAAPVASFPAVGYGIEKHGDYPPVFTNKKAAKQFTAKCAIDWLIAHFFMPSNLLDVTFPKGHIPTRPRSPSPSSSPSPSPPPQPSTKRPADEHGPRDNGAHLPPQPRSSSSSSSKGAPAADFEDASLPATQRVTALCRVLGMQPPRYAVTRSNPDVDKYFDGAPDFGSDPHHIPEGLGRVMWVVGSEKARQAVAGYVFDYLLTIYQERRRQLEA
ncbi:hypothetical protein VPNG_07454 [Cytospora leucostoma]|uniref:Uncharacterized protein n=1 Tax=Cytospora leucostoma TaxID=1230097 RepID=A0A423WMG3_9PEZI|nr:hypothetical protein VPNG_07454 [Cytospora leucostoma]